MPQKIVSLPPQHRAAEVRAASFSEADNTIEIVWTTGARVRRRDWHDGIYDEELEVTPKAVRIERLNAGAPFLNTHDSSDLSRVLGSVVPGSVKIEKGKGTARILLSRAPSDADAIQKIRDGIVRNISVGYRVHMVERDENAGDVPLHRVVDWEPLEISAVPIPADPGAQVRSGAATFPATIITKEGTMPNQDPNAASAELSAERDRSGIIEEIATRCGLPALGRQAIAAGTSIEEFRRQALDQLVNIERSQHPGGPGTQVGTPVYASPAGPSEFEERRGRAMANAMLHRAEPQRFKLDDGGADGSAFVAMPLLELARHSLEARGVRTAGLSKMNIAAAALDQRSGGLHSTSDFPAILANVANRTLRAGYEAAPQTFRPLVRVTTVADFKEVTRVQLGEAPQFDKVNESGEFKRGTIGEAGEKFRIATYGKVVGVTRQVIVNDDLNAFTRIPAAFGVQAAQLESDLAWAQILGNPTMGDNVALFHATHKNLGSGLPIGKAAVSAARLAMGLQTGLDGKTVLNIDPVYLIVSKAAQTDAETFLAPINPSQQTEAIPASLKALNLIAEPRLDNGIPRYNIAGDPNAFYFAAAAGAGVDLIELAYLEGAQGVYVETRQGFDVDGFEIKVRMDVGAKALDWRGFFKVPYAGS